MSDTGSSRNHRPRGPQHRPPPLLVIAATGLVLVLGLGITMLLLRGRSDGEKIDATAAAVPTASEAQHAPPSPLPPSTSAAPAPARAATPTATADPPPPAEVPEWERKPLRTAQPFPEEARIDPPAPPMKIPPEMLLPPAAPDAAGAP